MRNLYITFFLFLFFLTACGQNHKIKDTSDSHKENIVFNHKYTLSDFLTDNSQLDSDVDSILKSWDDKTIVAQLIMPAVGRLGLTNQVVTDMFKNNLIGGVLMLNGTKQEFKTWIDSYSKLNPYNSCLPYLTSADAEPSLFNNKIKETTPVIKANKMLHRDTVVKYTEIISKELNEIGINYNFSPVVDMSPNKTVGYRSFGEFPENIIPFSNSFIQTTQQHGIIATAKHFPGHGLVSGDTHKSLQVIDGELKEIKNYPSLIKDGLLSIMIGHLAVKNNKQYNTKGLPSTISDVIVTKLLRNEYGFKGLIVTDAMNMGGVASIPNADIKAIEAGCDILLMPLNIPKAHQALLTKYNSDPNFKKTVDNAAKRIIRMKLCVKK